MPIFDGFDKKPNSKRPNKSTNKKHKKRKQYQSVEPVYHKWAKKLHAKVKEHGMLLDSFNENKWANDFKELADKVAAANPSISRKQFRHILNYYLQRYGLKRLPYCNSVVSFRRFFYSIASQCNEDLGPYEEDIKISPRAQSLVKQLNFNWPKGADKQLPAVIELSLPVLDDWYNRMETAYQRLKKQLERRRKKEEKTTGTFKVRLDDNPEHEEGLIYLLRYLVRTNLSYKPDSFICNWYERVYDQVVNWDAWSGVLKPIQIHSQEFNKEMWTACSKRGVPSKMWDALKKELY